MSVDSLPDGTATVSPGRAHVLGRGAALVDRFRLEAPVDPLGAGGTPFDLSLRAALRSGRWSALTDLRGPFSVIGSNQATDSVFLGRDPMGQRPLYYAVLDDRVIASSYLPDVVDHPDVDDTLDPEAVALRYARCFHALTDRTAFAGVAQVPPGTVVVITDSGIRGHRYWDPREVGPASATPLPERAEELRRLLAQVVADYTATPGRVAAHVSGGLDSTAVAAFADDALRGRGSGLAAAYSWAPSPEQVPLAADYDERRFLIDACDQRSWTPSFAPTLPETEAAAGDPFRRPDMAWRYESRVAADARRRGVSVVLSGWGGDEAISGHGKLRVPELLGRGHWITAVRETHHWERDTRAQIAALLRAGRQAAAGVRVSPPRSRVDDLGDRLYELWRGEWPAVADQLQVRADARRHARTVRESHIERLTNGHIQERNASWFLGGMPHGVEHRSPLQDPRLVEFALRSDSSCFQHHGWRRVMFRLAIAGVVPDSVAWRIGKDDRIHRRMMQADPTPVPDSGREDFRALTAMAQAQRDLFHAAGRARDEQGSPPR